MEFSKITMTRVLLALPVALCLALVIVLDNAFYRALAVVALVLIETLRDGLSISLAASSFSSPKAKPGARKKKR